jgi:hypothetical protein
VYSGEYDICDVTLSVYPHRASVYPHRYGCTFRVTPHIITFILGGEGRTTKFLLFYSIFPPIWREFLLFIFIISQYIAQLWRKYCPTDLVCPTICGELIFIYSCCALFTSFEIDCFYGLWTWTYEYERAPPPPPIIDLPTPMAMLTEILKFNTYAK